MAKQPRRRSLNFGSPLMDASLSTPTPFEDKPPFSDDPHDSNYSESVPVSQHAKITPSQRKNYGEQFSQAAKKRVDKATKDLAEGRCVVTNTPGFYCVQYAHLLPRASDSSLLDKLEYFWGMKYGTLNVDSRYNVIWLTVSLHQLFDRNAWVLVPDEETVNSFLEHGDNEGFQALLEKQTMYNYTFVPARGMAAACLSRYSTVLDNEETRVGPDDFEPPHYYPFDKLPIITSHVHPHFVICNIGIKMQKGLMDYIGRNHALDSRTRDLLSTCLAIFQRWTQDIPVDSNFYHDPQLPPDDDDNNTTYTKRGRSDTHHHRRALSQRRVGASPSSKLSHKRQRNGSGDCDGLWLDDETLREFDDEASSTKRFKQKMESISIWISSISSKPFNSDVAVIYC